MEKVIFRDEEDNDLFIVKDLTNFILPKKGQGIVWMKLYMFVGLVEHNYDKKEIIVFVKLQ